MCVSSSESEKIKLNLYLYQFIGGGGSMDWVYDKFQDRNISLNLSPHIAYDI